MNDVDIAIKVAAETAAAAAGLDDVGNAARGMAEDVDKASKDASKSLDGVGDAVDGTASNASVLAGAFGDVAGGLGLIGLGGFSDELEAAAPALMLVAGAADIASVAMNTLSLSKIKDTAATVASKAASLASTAATTAQTAAQWALNVAMSANPIGLIIAAIVALVAGLVLAYNKSETFREIVQKVGEVGAAAIGWVVDKIGELVGWVKDTAPAAFGTLKDKAVEAFMFITTPQRTVINLIKDIVEWAKDKIPEAFETFKDKAKTAFDAATAPIQAVVNLIKDIVDWIGKIDLGIVGDIAKGLGKVLPGRVVVEDDRQVVSGRTTTTAAAPTEVFEIHIYDAYDPDITARKVVGAINGRTRRIGAFA